MSNPDPIVIHLQAKDDGVNEVFDSATRAAEKQKKAINDTLKRMKQYHRTLGMTKQQLEIFKLKQQGATKAQIRAAERIAVLTDLKEKDIQTNKRLNGSMRMIRGGFGQVGHQIQDVAVQAQMGTDAFIILGQQGGQIASLFGPGGAALGAILAVGAALYTSFKPAVDESASSVKEFVESITEQRKELGLLTAAEKELEELRAENRVEQLNEETKNYEDSITRLTENLNRYKRMLEGVEAGNTDQMYAAHLLGLSYQDLEEEVKTLTGDLATAKATIAGNTAATDENTEANLQAVEREQERVKSLEDLVKGIEDQAEAHVKGARARQLAEAVERGATAVELRRIATAYAAIDAFNAKKKADKEAADEAARTQAAADRQAKAEKKRLDDLVNSVADFALGREGVLERTFQAELLLLQQASLDAVGTEQRRNELIEALRRRHKDNLAALEGKPQEEEVDTEDEKQKKLIKNIKDLQALRKQAIQGIQDERAVFEEAMIAKIASIQAARDAEIISETEKTMALQALRQADLENQLDAQLKLVGGLQHLEQSAEDAMMHFITQGQSASEAMRMLGRSIMDEVLKGIIQMGIERVKQAVIAKQVEAGALSSSVMANAAAMAKIGAAAATPAALVSVATAGGAATAGAAGLYSAVGLAQALAAAGGSFEGGGFTGMGSRSGGIDGRGGFPAILHPNETVIDHTRGQGQGITIINNIDASGNQDVDEKIAIAVTQSSRQTVEQVHNMMRRGRM